MDELQPRHFHQAIEDFRQARRKAAISQLIARISGKSDDLLPFEEVRQQLKATNQSARGLQEIPVTAIVGSVGRYHDFTRDFLPKQDSDEHRWAKVKSAIEDLTGVPPIEVYQIGESYFVIDGNHRVSIARQLDQPTISAYVTEVQTRVPLGPNDDPDALICKARYAEFLDKTNLDRLRPGADLQTTFCGQYRKMLEHIDVHRYYMGLDLARDIDYEEAVTHWYDTVYLPVLQRIHEQGVLHDFPERTEADLYMLLAEHRADLAELLGWEVDTESAVFNLASQKSVRPDKVLARVGERLLDAVVPDELESGPETGHWRRERLARRSDNRLFADILMPLRDPRPDDAVLAPGLLIAQRENGRLLGVHVVKKQKKQKKLDEAALRSEFVARCQAAGVNGTFNLELGQPARTVVDLAGWADMVLITVQHPVGPKPLDRLGSGLQLILNRCPRPVLAMPAGVQSSMDRVLLAYDGSEKAYEALTIAAYLVAAWQVHLTVMHVTPYLAEYSLPIDETPLRQARRYLRDYGVAADYVLSHGKVTEQIMETAVARESNLLLIGGFSAQPVVRVMLGSTVEHLLRAFHQPILICR